MRGLLFVITGLSFVLASAYAAAGSYYWVGWPDAALFSLIKRVRVAAAALSIGLWCAVLLTGRWIAFAGSF